MFDTLVMCTLALLKESSTNIYKFCSQCHTKRIEPTNRRLTGSLYLMTYVEIYYTLLF